MTAERLNYTDLESELYDAVNMAEIASLVAEGCGSLCDGRMLMSECEFNSLIFAIHHTSRLAQALQKRWEQIHESNIAARGDT